MATRWAKLYNALHIKGRDVNPKFGIKGVNVHSINYIDWCGGLTRDWLTNFCLQRGPLTRWWYTVTKGLQWWTSIGQTLIQRLQRPQTILGPTEDKGQKCITFHGRRSGYTEVVTQVKASKLMDAQKASML